MECGVAFFVLLSFTLASVLGFPDRIQNSQLSLNFRYATNAFWYPYVPMTARHVCKLKSLLFVYLQFNPLPAVTSTGQTRPLTRALGWHRSAE